MTQLHSTLSVSWPANIPFCLPYDMQRSYCKAFDPLNVSHSLGKRLCVTMDQNADFSARNISPKNKNVHLTIHFNTCDSLVTNKVNIVPTLANKTIVTVFTHIPTLRRTQSQNYAKNKYIQEHTNYIEMSRHAFACLLRRGNRLDNCYLTLYSSLDGCLHPLYKVYIWHVNKLLLLLNVFSF